MAVNRAILEYANGFSKLEEPCLWYKPRSDFINLTKLIRLVLTKKKGREKGRGIKEGINFRKLGLGNSKEHR